MKETMTDEERAAREAAKRARLDELKKTEVEFHPSREERAAEPEKWDRWPAGVFFIESAAHSSSGKAIRTFYVRGKVQSTGQAFFEKAERPGHRVKNEKDADRIRTMLIEGTLQPNKERREKEAAAAKDKASKWTFDKLWEAWKADPENKGKRGTTKADQKYTTWLKHVSPEEWDNLTAQNTPKPNERIGKMEPRHVAPTDIDRLRLSLAKGHSKATTISVLGLIRRIERYGASSGRCPGLQFPIILKGKKLGRDPEVKRAPNEDEVAKYVETCKSWPDPQAGRFQLLIVYTGMRRGSARNLKWEDIDLDNATAVLRDSKTGDVPIVLSNDAVALLRSHPATEGNPYVFTGSEPDGRRSQRQIDREPAKIRDAAGLPKDFDPCHCFRRRLATRVEEAHGIATAMKVGGWKSPAMVINYTATTRSVLREAANLLNAKPAETKNETA